MKRWIVMPLIAVGFAAYVHFVGFSHSSRCDELALEVQQELDAFRECERDSDCRSVELGCPFECQLGVRRDKVLNALQAYSRYTRECMMFCGSCEGGPSTPRCIQGVCEIL